VATRLGTKGQAMSLRPSCGVFLAAGLLAVASGTASADDTGISAAQIRLAQADGPMVITPQPGPNRPQAINPPSPPPSGQAGSMSPDSGGPGRPYEPAPAAGGSSYVTAPPTQDSSFSVDEIKDAGHHFFGRVSYDLAKVIEYAFQRAGRPNGYILGEEAGGAFIAGLRYGEGTLYTKDAGVHKVYWQGPSVGYDFGADGSKTMVLIYDLQSPGEIFNTFGGIDGSAYFIGGVGITFLSRDHVTLAPISSGIGLRLGANLGYLKYTQQPTWNPF
jgi:hypothetical protein